MITLTAAIVSAALCGAAEGPTAEQCQRAFERLKSLAGTWGTDYDGDGSPDSTVTYEVVGAGSAVAETLMDGTPHEMITMYHMDGPRLLGTHYCAAGNQPRMAATAVTADGVQLEMFDVTNMPDPMAMHMNSVRFEFIDADHVTTHWGSMKGGKPDETADFPMIRKKEKAMEPAASEAEFIILMYEDDNAWTKLPPERQAELMKLYQGWVADLQAKGQFVSGSPCGSKQVLLTGRGAAGGGEVKATEHAPTKDVLTGFFIVRAQDLDAAVALARGCPALGHGERVIVRPAAH